MMFFFFIIIGDVDIQAYVEEPRIDLKDYTFVRRNSNSHCYKYLTRAARAKLVLEEVFLQD